ncbi:putative ribonuclease H-like domain-containing protein [Tanacetum coccineum]
MLKYTEKLNDQVKLEKLNDQVKLEESKARFDKWKESSKNLDKLINCPSPSIFDTTPEDVEGKPLYDRLVKAVGMHTVPSPITGTFMPPSNKPELDDTQVTYGSKSNDYFEANSVLQSSKGPIEHLALPLVQLISRRVSKNADHKQVPPLMIYWDCIINLCGINVANIPSFVPRAAYVPAGSRNPPASILWEDGELLLRPQQVVLGKLKGHICSRDPRTMDNPHKNKDLGIVDSGCSRSMTDITCLLAKASSEESTKWHIRMAHVNFKNINNLAKNGLVNGLPSKLFINDHNCVACNKGKQHKASYKAIIAVSTISEPLQLLHMDLFGPTSLDADHLYYLHGPKVLEASEMVESNSDYAEELARLQRQEHEANDTAEKYGFGFSKDTEEHLSQADMVPVGEPVHADETSLPPGHSLGSSEHSTRFPSPSDLANSISLSLEMEDIYHHPSTNIFSSSSYDADFGSTVTNLAPIVVVDLFPLEGNTIHPSITKILGDLTSPVQTKGTLKKSNLVM